MLENTEGPRVNIAFNTKWPVYFRGKRNNVCKTNGNINILTLESNITNYILVIELYNFTTYHQLEAIGLKIKRIFIMRV